MRTTSSSSTQEEFVSKSETHVSLWGGRFSGEPLQVLAALSMSTHFDSRLTHADIADSHARADELHRIGLLSDQECVDMHDALARLDADVASGAFVPAPDDENVHTAFERGPTGRAGAMLGGELRAGHSCNDRITTLIRMYLREEARYFTGRVLDIARALIRQAMCAGDAVMPGRTHMQHAQPALVVRYLLTHVWPLLRDAACLCDWDKRVAISPYGSGALAGNTLGMDSRRIAAALGFIDSVENSIDGTAARDVAAEFASVYAQIGIDILRLSEEIAIWDTKELGYVTLGDLYSTGLPIMLQKKSPDIAELAHGKVGRLIGGLTGLLAVLEGIPLAYDRDLQEGKEPVLDQTDILDILCPAVVGMTDTMTIRLDHLEELAPQGFSLATDIAEWFIKQGVPFRDTYETSGMYVRLTEARGVELTDLTDKEPVQVLSVLIPEIRSVLTVEGSVSVCRGRGGIAPERICEQIAEAEAGLADVCKWMATTLH